MKTIVGFLLVSVLFEAAFAINAEDTFEFTLTDSAGVNAADSVVSQMSDQYVIYYLHMNRRCVTCKTLEAYAKQAVETGFVEQLKDSSLVWQVVNFEEEGNEHFVSDYHLYSQSLIISKHHNGKEIQWKSLDKIWELVRNKDKFVAYVRAEVKDFMKPTEDK